VPKFRGILFDLFGTLVRFDVERLPEIVVEGQRVHSTVGALAAVLAEWCPDVGLEAFWGALRTVSEEMARARVDDHVELPSRERFRRALERVGCDERVRAEAAVHLSRAHMEQIMALTVFPPAHAELLAALRAEHRLGVVSNFDDTAAAYDILLRHGIAARVDVVVVSEALGLRKPHPAVVRVGVRRLGLSPGEVLFVGDTFADDVGGARAAGVEVAWIDTRGQGVPAGAVPPRYVLRTLPDLLPALAT